MGLGTPGATPGLANPEPSLRRLAFTGQLHRPVSCSASEGTPCIVRRISTNVPQLIFIVTDSAVALTVNSSAPHLPSSSSAATVSPNGTPGFLNLANRYPLSLTCLAFRVLPAARWLAHSWSTKCHNTTPLLFLSAGAAATHLHLRHHADPVAESPTGAVAAACLPGLLWMATQPGPSP